MAEATLIVSGGRRGEGFAAREFAVAELRRNRAVRVPRGQSLVSCGAAVSGHSVAIVDPASGEILGPGGIGEIQVSGPSIASGYWNNAGATREAFVERDGRAFLRTGDLGFVLDGELFVAGREKDLILVRGQNLYPQDIERTIESENAVVRGDSLAAHPPATITGPLCATDSGFSLHAATIARRDDPRGQEALLRYVLRPPLAQSRLQTLDNGLCRITLKRAFSDGTFAIDLDPLSLLCRLAAAVPAPLFNTVRYAGVLAPAAKWRPLVIPEPPAPSAADNIPTTQHPADDADRQPEKSDPRNPTAHAAADGGHGMSSSSAPSTSICAAHAGMAP